VAKTRGMAGQFIRMGGYVGSAPPCCYGSSLGSNPDIPQKLFKCATFAKEWPTHSSLQYFFYKNNSKKVKSENFSHTDESGESPPVWER
jgi:hypothetical protein